MSKFSLAGPENIWCVGGNGAFQRKSELSQPHQPELTIQNGGSERKQY